LDPVNYSVDERLVPTGPDPLHNWLWKYWIDGHFQDLIILWFILFCFATSHFFLGRRGIDLLEGVNLGILRYMRDGASIEPEPMEVTSQAQLNPLLSCIFMKCVRISGHYTVFFFFDHQERWDRMHHCTGVLLLISNVKMLCVKWNCNSLWQNVWFCSGHLKSATGGCGTLLFYLVGRWHENDMG
jgi:hypothetical protein